MRRIHLFWPSLIVCLALAYAESVTASQLAFPGETPTPKVVKIQKKADALYDAGKYKEALWYYQKELAPMGDKYGQYMVAHMIENGMGTAANKEKALAWYVLAAERGHDEIVKQSQRMQSQLTGPALARAKDSADALKQEYGDRALVVRLIRRDELRIRESTGSRRKGCQGREALNLRVYYANGTDFNGEDGSRFCARIERRIEQRSEYLKGYVTYGDLEIVEDELDRRNSERQE
ncbi:MAG: hypothetical protein AAGA84_05585 [Pseudomonadota bacterium]